MLLKTLDMQNTYRAILLISLVFIVKTTVAQEHKMKIDVNFPGGNILVSNVDATSTLYYDITDKDTIMLRPDLRDTPRNWFYWYFRVTGAENRTLHFQFDGNRFSAFGPAFSTDGGNSWQWLYNEPQENNRSFTFEFNAGDEEVRFSMGMCCARLESCEMLSKGNDNRNPLSITGFGWFNTVAADRMLIHPLSRIWIQPLQSCLTVKSG
jgi:hypothetical protein